jgi:thymidylate kinase
MKGIQLPASKQQRALNARTVMVSFSGVDGAGKSTQIEALRARAEHAGLRVHVVRFWDDIARLKTIRETSGHKLFKGDKGVGSPSVPINRRDKNVQSGPITCIRLFLYLLDAGSTRLVFHRMQRSGFNLVIFDRYTYDELANLNLDNPLMRTYARMLMAFVPRPHISYVLDADPAQARARKPEYPLDFVERNRSAYWRLADLLGGMTIIPAMPVRDVEAEVLAHAAEKLLSPASGTAHDRWPAERRA